MKWLLKPLCYVLLLLVVAALVAVGWFRWAQHVVAARMTAPTLTVERKVAPDMQYQTLNGRPMHLSDSKGKVVFLDLWGTWCVQCVAEMPTVQKLYDRYCNDPRVQMLIVSRMDSPSQIQSFSERNHYKLPFF